MTSTTDASEELTATEVSLFERLGDVWLLLEEYLDEVPVLRRLEEGTVTLEDYQRLLFNLRQQVVDSSPWISRAASISTSRTSSSARLRSSTHRRNTATT